MIGWEDDNASVGPIAAAAKQSLLRLIPHFIPLHNDGKGLYRLVLEHSDFGVHNMLITEDANGLPLVTSVCVWLGNSMHCACDIIRFVDGSGSWSGDKWGCGPFFYLGIWLHDTKPREVHDMRWTIFHGALLVQFFLISEVSNFPSLYSHFPTERQIIS